MRDVKNYIKCDNNVSVIISTYNECRNVRKCIESVLNADERIDDIIIVDDCSTDNTKRIVKNMNNPKVRFFTKNHKTHLRGKNDSIYVGAHLANNENIIIMDCDTVVKSLSECIDKLQEGYDIVGTIIDIIPNGSILSKCEQIEYRTSIRIARPWLFKHLNYINNVSGAGFGIKRRHIIENHIPPKVLGEDMTLTQIGLIKGWKIALSNSVVETYATPNLKALYKQRQRWTWGYYSIIRETKRYVPLVESLTVYYRTLVCSAFIALGGHITGHFILFTLLTLCIYFINEYRFVKNIKWTLIMMIYRQLNFISALTFFRCGGVWKVIR